MTPAPQIFRWNGRVMEPLRHALAERAFTIGDVYRLAIDEERSTPSHNHLFACVTEAWRNLPERYVEQFPTPDHLRRRALIEAGYFDQETIACGSHEVACRVAAFAGRKDPYSLISVTGNFVIVRTAKSQSRKDMNAAEFQETKAKVLEIIAAMLDTKPATLAREACYDDGR